MAKEQVTILSWRSDFEQFYDSVYSIGDDFILLDSPIIPASFEYPFKMDSTSVIISLAGTTRGKINLVSYETPAPSMIIIPADQIMEYEYISEDFRGLFIIMSKKFTDSLNIDDRLTVFRSVNENPCIPLSETELPPLINYFEMMRHATTVTDNPYRFELAQNLTRAFFYGGGFYFHKLGEQKRKNKRELAVDQFLKLLEANFKQHRDIDFYAARMGLTPKYMSAVIKENSGRSASEWIEDKIIVEAKVMLKSSGMPVQQIADELGFLDQSGFGRYFKRLVGVSPKQYRK